MNLSIERSEHKGPGRLGMMEYKVIDGHFVRKELHPRFRNRDGYAKVCYSVYSNKELFEKCVPDCGRYYTMKDVKEAIRMMKD